MKVLIERLANEPGNIELKQEIRHLDPLARKSFFTSQWQMITGSYMLFFVGIFLVLAFAFATSLASVDHLKLYSITETPVADPLPANQGIEIIEVGVGITGDETEPELPTQAEPSPVTESTEALVTVAAFPDAAQIRANSPSFRGPFGNGIFSHKNIPTDFDGPSGKNILWKTTLPLSGYNSPVIWGNRLFLSGASDQKREVYCIDIRDGKILWTGSVDRIFGSPAVVPKTTEDTGLAAPSLATDGIQVFAIFGTGDIISFDMEGNRVWARNLGVPYNHYGHSSSLLVFKEKLFVQYDTNKGQRIMALNGATGATIWETRRNVRISWASPILALVDGKYQIILASDPYVAGYDIETGKELWATRSLMGEIGPSPAFGEGLVFATQEYATLVAINPSNGQIVWQSNEYLSEVASPVVAGGMVFIATSYGVLASFDAKTGVLLWENDGGITYYSSPVVADNKLFIFDKDGRLQVYAIEREKKLLAESNLNTQVVSTPAFSDGRMFVRSGVTLWCIGK